MAHERRRSPRIEILDRVQGHLVALDLSVVVRDFSLGGMSIATSLPLQLDSLHDFQLTLGDGSTVVLSGRIRRVNEQLHDGAVSYVCGIEFVDQPTDGDGRGDVIDKIK